MAGRSVRPVTSRLSWPGWSGYRSGAAPAVSRRGAPTYSAAPWPGGGRCWPCTARRSWPASRCWSPTCPASTRPRAGQPDPGRGRADRRYLLPRDLDRCGLLAGLTGRQLADALAEAIHAGSPGQARTDRAVDVRVLEQLTSALAGRGLTPARLAAAVQAALGRDYPAGLLTKDEAETDPRACSARTSTTHIGANLIRLDAFLSPPRQLLRHRAARSAAARRGAPSWRPNPAARSARAELIAALVIQWLTVQVSVSSSADARRGDRRRRRDHQPPPGTAGRRM